MVYRIPMQNKIGNEAMGIYSSAYYIYNIMLLLSSYSLPLAVSKMVSARVALGQHKNAYRIFQSSLVFSLISGGLACLVTFFGADFFAGTILSEPAAAYSIRVLAPTIFVMAFLGTLRGYFQGMGTMIPTAVSQVLEQIINAGESASWRPSFCLTWARPGTSKRGPTITPAPSARRAARWERLPAP